MFVFREVVILSLIEVIVTRVFSLKYMLFVLAVCVIEGTIYRTVNSNTLKIILSICSVSIAVILINIFNF